MGSVIRGCRLLFHTQHNQRPLKDQKSMWISKSQWNKAVPAYRGSMCRVWASAIRQRNSGSQPRPQNVSYPSCYQLSVGGGPTGQQGYELSPPSHIWGLKCSHQRCQSCFIYVLQVAGQIVDQSAKWLAKSGPGQKRKKISFIKRNIGQVMRMALSSAQWVDNHTSFQDGIYWAATEHRKQASGH